MAKKKAEKAQEETIDEKVLENLGGKNEEVKAEEPVKEETIEVTKEEPKKEEVKVEAPAIDVDKLREELKGDVAKEVTDKIVKAISGEATQQEQDDYDKFVSDYTEKNGKAPEWKEVAIFIKEKAKEEINAEIEADQKAQEEAQKLEAESNEKYNQDINKYWEEQEKELESKGVIPAVVDKDDPNDPGRQARIKIYQKLQEVDEERKAQGLPRSLSIKEILFDYPDVISNELPGADAPINRGSRATSTDSTKGYKYSDLKPGTGIGSFLRDILGNK